MEAVALQKKRQEIWALCEFKWFVAFPTCGMFPR